MNRTAGVFGRDPAIELYRILLMLGIVTLHTLQCVQLGFSPLARWVEFCVDGFVFISGWYGIKFGWKKVAKLYGLALWCSAIYALARWAFFSNASWSAGAFVSEAVHRSEWYWFVNAYVVLMCLAPVVNAALESQKSRKVFVPILIAVFGWSFACMVPGLKSWMPCPAGFGSHTFFTLLGVYVVARIARLDCWDERFSTKHLIVALVVLSLLALCNLNKYNSPVAVLLGGVLFVLFHRLGFRRGGGYALCDNCVPFAFHALGLSSAWLRRGLHIPQLAQRAFQQSVLELCRNCVSRVCNEHCYRPDTKRMLASYLRIGINCSC